MQESLYASHTDQTYRPPSTALLVLDSNDRAYWVGVQTWSPNIQYPAGTRVLYSIDDDIYVAINSKQTNTPNIDTTNWMYLGPSPSYNYTIGGESNGSATTVAGSIGSDNSVGQPYNNFRLQKPQPLLQGGFQRLAVSEITINYNIPNVNDYTNYMWVGALNTNNDPPTITYQKIVIPNDYYTGTALATALETTLNNNAVFETQGFVFAVGFNASLGFTIGTLLSHSGLSATSEPLYLYPYDPTQSPPGNLGTTLLDVMGFNPKTNWNYCTSGSTQGLRSVGASLIYTKYIDICSNKLTYYQKVTDQNSRRSGAGSNVIARFYITDNSALPEFSPFPYVLTRQYNNAKSIRWDKNTSIDWCDIFMLDDSGRPLYYNTQTAMSGDFQITLLATED